jgi:Domain of unknown function (DUF4082)
MNRRILCGEFSVKKALVLVTAVATLLLSGCGGSGSAEPVDSTSVSAETITTPNRTGNETVARKAQTSTATLSGGQQTTWDDATVPAVQAADDTNSVEVGVRFSVGTTGTINAIRFYRGALGNGSYQVNLWQADGTLVGTGRVYEGLQAPVPGWQEIALTTPVVLKPGAEYVASYFTSGGAYAVDQSFFNRPLSSNQILMPTDAGVYRYGDSGGFPVDTYLSSNYWVAPVFTPASNAPPTSNLFAPTIFSLDTVSSSAANIRFSPGGVGSGEVSSPPLNHLFYVDNQFVGLRPFVAGSLVRLDVAPEGGTHTVAIRGQAADGSLSALSNVSSANFPAPRTLANGPFGLFAPHVSPNFQLADSTPTEVGIGFKAAVSGKVRGVRFYKGNTATGPFTGSLWTADGQLIATTGTETLAGFGYRDLLFNRPVKISAGTGYVVSYFSPNGRYGYSGNYFGPGAVNFFPLATTTSGLRRLGSTGFPDTTDNALSNFFVDVIFEVPPKRR